MLANNVSYLAGNAQRIIAAVCCIHDKVLLEPASLEECLRLDLLAERSVLAAPSCLMYVVAVLLHSDLVCSAEAAVASNPALVDV